MSTDNKAPALRGKNKIFPRRRGLSQGAGYLPYLFIAPLLLFIGFLTLYPTAVTTVLSFFSISPLNEFAFQFNGLDNFVTIFNDPSTQASLFNSLIYLVLGVVGSTVFGVAIAVALKKSFRFRGIVLALVVLPWALPGVMNAVIWNWIYHPSFGVLNSALTSLHLIGDYQVWIGLDRFLTLTLIETVQIWQLTPLSAVIILAALQNIPLELSEAAQIDGGGRWRVFRSITLPLIRPGVALAAVQAAVLSLNLFDQVYVLNGTATTGSSVMSQTYLVAFQNLQFGEAYALTLLITLATVVVSLGLLGLIHRRVEF